MIRVNLVNLGRVREHVTACVCYGRTSLQPIGTPRGTTWKTVTTVRALQYHRGSAREYHARVSWKPGLREHSITPKGWNEECVGKPVSPRSVGQQQCGLDAKQTQTDRHRTRLLMLIKCPLPPQVGVRQHAPLLPARSPWLSEPCIERGWPLWGLSTSHDNQLALSPKQ